MSTEYKKLGQYIRTVDIRNTDLVSMNLLGVSVKKQFIPSIANTVGTDFKKYKVVKKGQFTYIPDTSRRGDKIGIALLENYEIGIVSNIYIVFEIIDTNQLMPEYLMLWFSRPEFDRYARFKSHGSVREIFDWDEMCNVELPVPDIEKQRKIVKAYQTITDRIALKQKINENLELQAQAIFKSWFVDFEPFGGVMPEDWKVGSLSDIVDVLSGKRPPMKQNNKTEDVDIPLVGAAAIMGYTNKFNHDDKILVIGRVGTHGIVQRFDYPCWTSDNTLVIKSNCYEYIYQILKLIDYKAMNRGSTQPLITQGDLKKTEIIIPSKECLQKYEDVVGSLMYRYSQNRIENEKLALLRDTLLPKLMNGEIDVSEIKI